MSISAMLVSRKRLLGIDDDTVRNIRLIHPTVVSQLDVLVKKLYQHLLSFPDCERLLASRDIKGLQAKQKAHWSRMFECNLDEAYANYAIHIGQIHFNRKILPYIYLAGYNIVQNLLIARIYESAHGRHEQLAIIASISRIITLDIDLALSAYTRAFWSGGASAGDDSVFI